MSTPLTGTPPLGTPLTETSVLQDPSPSMDFPSRSWPGDEAKIRCRSQLTECDRSHIDQLAYKWGTAPESYDIVISEGSFLETPGRDAVLSVLPNGRYWHMPGGILAPDELKPAIVSWLKEIAERQKRTVAVYSVGDEEVSLFREAGYEVNKFGEEPYLPLGDLTWKGKDYEWIRRQTNYCRRQGLEVSESLDPDSHREMGDELVEILNEDLRRRTYARPLKLLVGDFDPHALHRRRLFVARSQETGRLEGFLACSPMKNGTAWSFETFRKRSDSPRGTMAFLFREVVDQLQAEGVQEVSLCLVPGKGVNRETAPEAHWLVRSSLDLWYTRLNFLFNTRGQNYFKSRFRPQFRNRYVCVTPKSTCVSILSFLNTVGAFTPHLGNIARNLWHHCDRHVPD
ncbi:MAG: DUF2156 domain-containing protein [Planctomycetaceae bacterium]|nr:DUF2156 domain-containing protein [Planctomycetaceae bacterium]